MNRLPKQEGEWIDRQSLLTFTFEGENITAYAGDTISSALWASGRRILGRSFKYHRPRGILSLANHDINAMMQDGAYLNLRADVVQAKAEMNLSSINTFGGVQRDRAAVLDRLSRFLPVGFYYKTFLDKNQFPFWERMIRFITGLGAVDTHTPRLRTPKRYDFCDVLVIGSGISGLCAAIAAADAGADVVLVDENAHLGGAGHYQRGGAQGQWTQTNERIAQAQKHPKIRIYTETFAAGYYADHWIPLVHPNFISKMRARAVIVASGAYEQPAVFRNNDLPGVMLASAAQRLIYRYAVKPMERAVVLTANSDGYRAALDLQESGVEVMAIVEMRSHCTDKNLKQRVQQAAIPIFYQHCIYEAHPNPSADGVSLVTICPLDAQGHPQTDFLQSIPCDGVLMSVGWAPTANLLYQAGTKMRFEEALQQFIPNRLPEGIFACGRVNGVFDWEQKQQDGQSAGQAAAVYLGLTDHLSLSQRVFSPSECPSHPYPIIPHPKGKNFVDFDEDLQYKDFIHAVQEGFDNIELLKRYTTVGMGPSQGKHSNMNAIRILSKYHNLPPEAIGTTTARPMFHPVPMAHLAGRGFMPERQTPLHSRHQQQGAVWMPAGQWQRPAYYAQDSLSRDACIQREVAAVHQRVGLIDVGTLGKLELWGHSAAEFLERIYTGKFAKMKVGTTRYALMVDESGIVIDDGVVARLASDRFYFTTTTSGSARIYRELSRLNTLWQVDCGIVNLTGARAAVNLAGPRSQQVLQTLTPLDLSADNFPYLAVREAEVAGISAIIMRVGFVGEWGYEIHVPAEEAIALWDALMTAGASEGITPFGVEAQRLLRLEKGHVIISQDTDGLTTPYDANLAWAVKMDKPFFVGQRSLQILQKRSPRQKLVGFTLPQNFQGTPPQECHLVIHDGEIAGRVTSIGFSKILNRYIGLAYLTQDLTEIGTTFSIRLSDSTLITATVAPTPFYDPENQRQTQVSIPQEVLV